MRRANGLAHMKQWMGKQPDMLDFVMSEDGNWLKKVYFNTRR